MSVNNALLDRNLATFLSRLNIRWIRPFCIEASFDTRQYSLLIMAICSVGARDVLRDINE